MLLVHDHHAQFVELDFLLDQGVRPNHELGIALRDVTAGLALAIVFHGAGQENDAIACAFENTASREIMLLREDFGGRHQRNLISVLHRDNCGFEGNDGFARAYVALQQAAHGKRFLHVGGDFLQHPLLRRRGMKWKNLLDGGAGTVV